eukprot:COSAG02_NODE_30764_length_545_cov_1.939462_1_plen_80_part_10
MTSSDQCAGSSSFETPAAAGRAAHHPALRGTPRCVARCTAHAVGAWRAAAGRASRMLECAPGVTQHMQASAREREVKASL